MFYLIVHLSARIIESLIIFECKYSGVYIIDAVFETIAMIFISFLLIKLTMSK